MVALLSLVLILPMNTKTPMVDVKLLGKLVFSINQEPFDNISLEKMVDATWHYVGKQLIDLNAKSLPLQLDGEAPLILFKPKKERGMQIVELKEVSLRPRN